MNELRKERSMRERIEGGSYNKDRELQWQLLEEGLGLLQLHQDQSHPKKNLQNHMLCHLLFISKSLLTASSDNSFRRNSVDFKGLTTHPYRISQLGFMH